MITQKEINQLPHTLEEFMRWEPQDGFKYEWNDGELIKFEGMNKNQLYLYEVLLELFFEKGLIKTGTLVAEQHVNITGIQMRRPDIAYFTKAQVLKTRLGEDEIPEFAIEVISTNDQINLVKNKITEYFKNGVKVVWLIYPDEKMVEVYTSRKVVKICSDADICSARPVLDDFEISVDNLFKENN